MRRIFAQLACVVAFLAIGAVASQLDGTEICNMDLPSDAMECGAASPCDPEQAEWYGEYYCTGNTTVQNDVVTACDSDVGTCSQWCGAVGNAVCTETFACEVEIDSVTLIYMCVPGDPVLDSNGDPIVSIKPEHALGSCVDNCY